MAKGKRIPRFRRGSVIYRVEWKKQKPELLRYVVETGSVLSIVVKDASEKEQIVVGRDNLRQFSDAPEAAVALEFERIASDVVKHGRDTAQSLQQVLQLGPLIGKKK